MLTKNKNFNITEADAETIIKACKAYFELEKYDSIIEKLSTLIRINNDYKQDQIFFELAKAYFFKNDYINSEKYFIKSSKYDFYRIHSFDFLGKIYKKINLIDKSIKVYTSILKIEDNNYSAIKELTEIYFSKKKDYAEAFKYSVLLLKLSEYDLYANVIKLKINVLKDKEYYADNDIEFILNITKNVSYDVSILSDLAKFMALNGRFIDSISIINNISKNLSKDEINDFFNGIVYDFSSYLKNIDKNNEKEKVI